MAFRGVRFFLGAQSHRYTRARYNLLFLTRSMTQLFPFSTLDSQPTASKTRFDVDERVVLNELSDLFAFGASKPEKPLETAKSVSEVFLTPEDRLRGVFLQKLRGKAAIERALSNVGVELDIDVLAKVVNWGNLDGEKMVTFFNWAVKKNPNIPKNLDTYKIILKALGRRKFTTQMLDTLSEMEAEKIGTDSETLEIVTDALVRARRISKAVEMVRDSESLRIVLERLSRRAWAGSAESLLNSTRARGEIEIGIGAYNAVIGGWSRLGSVEGVERALATMAADDAVAPDGTTLRHVVDGLGRAGRAGDAVKVLLEAGPGSDEPGPYNVAISGMARAGRFDECLRLYEEVLTLGPNLETFEVAVDGFLRGRRVADALEAFDEMFRRGFRPRTGTVTSFLRRLCGFGPPHAAVVVYNRARRAGCEISLSAYKLLLSRLARFGKCGTLLGVWDEMRESGHSSDVEVYEFVVQGLCNNGQVESAVLVMEECLRAGFSPSRFICSKLNRKLFDSGGVERAYRLFLKIKEARLSENDRVYWRSKGWHF